MTRRTVFSRLAAALGFMGVAKALPSCPRSGQPKRVKPNRTSTEECCGPWSNTQPDQIGMATEDELFNLPPGLYRLPGYRTNQLSYGCDTDEWMVSDQRLLARVRPQTADLPIGVDIMVRHDGFQIIKQWCPVGKRRVGRRQELIGYA